MKNNLKILTSFWFLIGLTVLLLNDFIFKELYGNWLTGKLSDFAGLFVFPLFWTAIFKKYKNPVFLFTALFFIFWKSPFSQSFINTWNDFIFFKITRVVDHTDLIALIVLPIAYQYENDSDTIKSFKINPAIPFVFALFSFMATSLPFNELEVQKEYSFEFPKDTLVNRIYHLPVVQEHIENICTRDSANTYWVYRMSEQDTIWTEEDLINRIIQNPMHIDINEDFCIDGYSTELAIKGDNNKSSLELKNIFHRCRKNEWKKSPIKGETEEEKLINSFENKIIEKLKNSSPN